MKTTRILLPLVMLSCAYASAQQQDPSASAAQSTTQAAPATSQPSEAQLTSVHETVVVTGEYEPVPLDEADRSVTLLPTNTEPLLFNSMTDYLRLDPSLDLRERGTDGVQGDLSIRGAAFGQTLVLLNGIRLNDPQSAHHNLDIPVPLESVSSIEVLHGAGSTLYGADAMGGVVNFITGAPESDEVRLRAGVGNFGFNQQRIIASRVARRWSEQLTASRDFSSGFMADRDFRSSSIASQSRFTTGLGQTFLLLAGSDRPFGANQFYGNFDSWERTKGWYGALSQQLGGNTTASVAFRRHSDEFVLFRDQPQIYENNHVTESWDAALRRRNALGQGKTFFYGAEFARDAIASNNLGQHNRFRGSAYADFDMRALKRFSFSLGSREEAFSDGVCRFLPSVGGGWWITSSLRLRANVSRAFRLPTYTDLYYHDPANVGNPDLRPESAWSFEAGPRWDAGGRFSAQATVFHRREHDVIDYARSAPNSPWQAMNIDELRSTGVESDLRYRFRGAQQVDLGYTGIYASRGETPGTVSRYVFDYASNEASFGWIGQLPWKSSARTQVGIVQRYHQDAYPLWDFAIARETGPVRPYLQFSNLSNTGYQAIQGVRMPGRSVTGGLEFVWARKK